MLIGGWSNTISVTGPRDARRAGGRQPPRRSRVEQAADRTLQRHRAACAGARRREQVDRGDARRADRRPDRPPTMRAEPRAGRGAPPNRRAPRLRARSPGGRRSTNAATRTAATRRRRRCPALREHTRRVTVDEQVGVLDQRRRTASRSARVAEVEREHASGRARGRRGSGNGSGRRGCSTRHHVAPSPAQHEPGERRRPRGAEHAPRWRPRRPVPVSSGTRVGRAGLAAHGDGGQHPRRRPRGRWPRRRALATSGHDAPIAGTVRRATGPCGEVGPRGRRPRVRPSRRPARSEHRAGCSSPTAPGSAPRPGVGEAERVGELVELAAARDARPRGRRRTVVVIRPGTAAGACRRTRRCPRRGRRWSRAGG